MIKYNLLDKYIILKNKHKFLETLVLSNENMKKKWYKSPLRITIILQ